MEPAQFAVMSQLSVRRVRARSTAIATGDFYRTAFGAVEVFRVGGTDDAEAVVSQLTVGNASFWVSDEAPAHINFSPEFLNGGTVKMLLIVPDPDAVIATAVSAGARLVYPTADEHGWRLGRIEDPFGLGDRKTEAWPPWITGPGAPTSGP